MNNRVKRVEVVFKSIGSDGRTTAICEYMAALSQTHKVIMISDFMDEIVAGMRSFGANEENVKVVDYQSVDGFWKASAIDGVYAVGIDCDSGADWKIPWVPIVARTIRVRKGGTR
jgi:hypothetical protein